MKAKNKRLSWILVVIIALALATTLTLMAFQDSIVFFYSPSEIIEKKAPATQRIRIGGLVEAHSIIRKQKSAFVSFNVTDFKSTIVVKFKGILPDLFRENQGIVAEGIFENGVFFATEVLAKHDENYMPKEVAEKLKSSGKWKGGIQRRSKLNKWK